MSAVKVGVVGVGRFGQHHARLYAELTEFDLIGVHDIDLKRGRDIALRCGTEFFEEYEALLEAVDAISIVTPTVTHHEVSLAPLKRGIHTLVEKPMSITEGEAVDLIDAATASGAALATGFLERFNPAFTYAAHRCGDLQMFKADRLGSWVGRAVTTDVVSDLMIHDLDLLALLDPSPVAQVISSGASLASSFIDAAQAQLTLESGVAASLEADRASERRFRQICLHGSEAVFTLDMINQHVSKARKAEMNFTWDELEIEKSEPLRDELIAFAHLIRGEDSRIAQGVDGMKALAHAKAINDVMNTST
jgi:predicted dehydrogenase